MCSWNWTILVLVTGRGRSGGVGNEGLGLEMEGSLKCFPSKLFFFLFKKK
jgi:hypothetical protein